MQEPSVRTSRLAIAAGLAAIFLVGSGGFMVGRMSAPAPPVAPPVTPAPLPAPSPLPNVVRDFDRADLIALAERAADSFASGETPPKEIEDAAGRRFSLLLPFGCTGPNDAQSGVSMRWQYDESAQVLRVTVDPARWTATDWNLDEENAATTAQGFWISRPWLNAGTCPPRAEQAMPRGTEALTLPGQTLAIAQFAADRTERDLRDNGRPFETVQRITKDRFDNSRGLRLRVKGRVAAAGGGGPVRCIQPGGTEQRPICVIGANIDSIELENPASGAILANWSTRRPGQ